MIALCFIINFQTHPRHGAPIIMLIVLTLLALLFGVKFSKAPEGGIKLAIPYWYRCHHPQEGMELSQRLLQRFVENTGIQLDYHWHWLGTSWPSLGGLPGHFTSCWLCWSSTLSCLRSRRLIRRYLDISYITGLLVKWYADNNGVSKVHLHAALQLSL